MVENRQRSPTLDGILLVESASEMQVEEESLLQSGKMNGVKRGHSTLNQTIFCIVSIYGTAVITFGSLGGQ